MWRRLVFALIGLSLTVVAVHSQSLWRGAGGRTCAQFTEDIKNSPEMEMLYFQWAQGFLSASNLLASYYKEKKNIEVHIADLDALSRRGELSPCHSHMEVQHPGVQVPPADEAGGIGFGQSFPAKRNCQSITRATRRAASKP
jgi:hypothetical protein